MRLGSFSGTGLGQGWEQEGLLWLLSVYGGVIPLGKVMFQRVQRSQGSCLQGLMVLAEPLEGCLDSDDAILQPGYIYKRGRGDLPG